MRGISSMDDGNDVIAEALPGAMKHDDGVVTFALYAPWKKSVHLAGSFNNWDYQRDRLEQRDRGYWVLAKKLGEGRHHYQFVIDESLWISDPYAQEIAVIEGRDEPHAVIEVGGSPYRWKHADWRRPPLSDLILYELHIGDFSSEGTFQGVIDRLDYLKDLGVNAIECMPWVESLPRSYWGYTPTHYLAPRRSYGSPTDLKRMIDEAHGRGVAVILDMVLNHTGKQHPFMKMYRWKESPWYGPPIGERNQFGLPTLDFTKPATNAFVRDVQAYWLRFFQVDGFRYDYLAGLGSNENGDGLPYLMKTARQIRPEAYLIGECIPENPDLLNGSGLSATWHTRSRGALDCMLRERDEMGLKWDDLERTAKVLDPATQGYDSTEFMINYLECHDDIRVMRSLADLGFDEQTARRKAMLGATLLMTMPGEPMLYHGQEWGEPTKKSLDANKVHWDLLDTPSGRRLHEHYRDLCRLRREHTALRDGRFAWLELNARRRTFVYHRWAGDDDHVVVAANVSSREHAFNIAFPRSGSWRDHLEHRPLDITGRRKLHIDAYDAKVLTFAHA